jgi:hypothetical protein
MRSPNGKRHTFRGGVGGMRPQIEKSIDLGEKSTGCAPQINLHPEFPELSTCSWSSGRPKNGRDFGGGSN